MTRHTKYLRIAEWARKRYTTQGKLVISTGGVLSKYARIEDAAFQKYMRLPRDAGGAIVARGAA